MAAGKNIIPKISNYLLLEIIIVIIGLLTLNSTVYTVNEINQVVIAEMGRPIKTVKKPGLYIKKPFIQRANKFEDRLLEYDAVARRCVTEDKKYIFLDNYARWKIVDPLLFMKTVKNEAGAHARLDDIIYSVVREEVAKYNMMEIIRTSDREIISTELTWEGGRKEGRKRSKGRDRKDRGGQRKNYERCY